MIFVVAAFAHGPPPRAEQVLHSDADGPIHLALTEGLAVREGSRYRFVCPVAWDSLPDRPVGISDGSGTWLLGAAGRIYLSEEGWPSNAGNSALSASRLLDLDRESGLSLMTTSDGVAVYDVAAGDARWSSAETWSSVAVWDERIRVAANRDGMIVLHTVGADTATLWEDPGSPLLRVDGGEPHVLLRSPGRQILTSLDGQVLAEGDEEILGPVDGWVVVDGDLQRLGEDVVAVGVSCLERVGEQIAVCLFPDLYRLDEVVGDRLFEIASVLPPDLDSWPEATRTVCEAEWRRFAGDVGIDPDIHPPDSVEGSVGRGCTHGPPKGWWTLASLVGRRARP